MQIIKYMKICKLYMLNKINNLSEIKLFFYFLIIIFLSRSLFLIFSLSEFPWFYEWEAMRYLAMLKNKEISISSFMMLYEIKNQFQMITKLLYLGFFKINNYVWSPKFFTILIQIIPSIYIAIIIKNLFQNNIRSYFFLFLLIVFSIFPGSLANYYHFSESHFYLHIFLSIMSFEVYSKFKNKPNLKYFLIFILFILTALNMEFVALTLFVTFTTFFFYKYFEEFDKKNLYLFIFFIIISFLYYKALYFFEVPSINDGSQLIEKKLNRSLYLILKGTFHQNSILFGIFFLYAIFNFKFYLNKINENKHKDFIILITIFFLIFVGSVAFSRIQIYDRYRDLIQVGGFISLFILGKIIISGKVTKIILNSLGFLIITYNTLFFLDKFYERRQEVIKYDYTLNKTISSYILENKIIKTENLDKNSKKYIEQIIISVDNKIINTQ